MSFLLRLRFASVLASTLACKVWAQACSAHGGYAQSGADAMLGVMTIGGQLPVDQANQFLNKFAMSVEKNSSVVYFDSAHAYNNGRSSEAVGKWMAQWHADSLRNESLRIHVATKVNPWTPSVDGWMKQGLSAARMRQQFQEELERLKSNSVDLLYLHAPDPTTPIEESVGQMAAFVKEGKARAWGLSNYAAWQVADIVHLCRQRGWPPPQVYQGMYNAITRRVEAELFPCLRQYGIAFYAYNVLAGGFLTGKHASSDDIPASGRFAYADGDVEQTVYQERYWKETNFKAIDIVKSAADNHGIPLAEASIRWIMHHSAIVLANWHAHTRNGVLLGASSFKNLDANIAAVRAGPLPSDLVVAFDKAWDITRAVAPCYFWPGTYNCDSSISLS